MWCGGQPTYGVTQLHSSSSATGTQAMETCMKKQISRLSSKIDSYLVSIERKWCITFARNHVTTGNFNGF